MDKKEIIEYLKSMDTEELFSRARSVREKYFGREVFIRGIIEFSSFCCRDCLYCGLRRSNRKAQRFRMETEQILALAEKIINLGVRTIVLQSGDDFYYTSDMICSVIKGIKKICPDTAVTLSLGERPLDEYKAFYQAGTDRYLLKHEAADPDLYKRLHPGQEQRERIARLEYMKKAGFQIGAGGMVGVPFQTMEDLADDILFTRDIEADMAGFGPFIPQHNTPLADHSRGSADLTLKVMALTRILCQDILLPVTTAFETVCQGNGLIRGLEAGANVIMPDFTPDEERAKYEIYDHKARITLESAVSAAEKAGMKINWGRGDSPKGRD